LRRPPAQLADRRCRVWDTAKHHHAGGVEAFEGAGVDRDALLRSAVGPEENGEKCAGDYNESERWTGHLSLPSKRLDIVTTVRVIARGCGLDSFCSLDMPPRERQF
jgi:hypothetical protein